MAFDYHLREAIAIGIAASYKGNRVFYRLYFNKDQSLFIAKNINAGFALYYRNYLVSAILIDVCNGYAGHLFFQFRTFRNLHKLALSNLVNENASRTANNYFMNSILVNVMTAEPVSIVVFQGSSGQLMVSIASVLKYVQIGLVPGSSSRPCYDIYAAIAVYIAQRHP